MSKLRILFAGTPEFAATHLEALLKVDDFAILAVYTQPDRRAGRGKKLQASPVKVLAQSHQLVVEQPASLKEGEALQQLQAYNADLLIVVAYGLLLPLAVLQAPRLGCINVHASLLPRWRGAAPIERAVEAGDKETGVTVMQMDVGLDTGDMLLKQSTAIKPDDTGDSLRERLAEVGVAALIDYLLPLARQDKEQQKIEGEQQDNSLANYATKLEKSEALLDWQLDAEVLDRKIHAFHSSNVTFTWLDDQRVRIWMSRVEELAGQEQETPGTILAVNNSGILVACGSKALRLMQLQMPGGKPLAAAQLLNAKAQLFQPGIRFTHANSQTD